MLIMKKADIAKTIGILIGILISGSDLLRVESFAFFAIRRIRIPVAPPEITPPIPRMNVKPTILKYVTKIYRVRGIRDVKMKFLVLDILTSRRNVALSE